MSNNFNDILSVLDTINKEVVLPVFIPSLQKNVNFKTINTGQQKSILKAAVDNRVLQFNSRKLYRDRHRTVINYY